MQEFSWKFMDASGFDKADALGPSLDMHLPLAGLAHVQGHLHWRVIHPKCIYFFKHFAQ
jgi:hypothetical protein